MTTRIARRWPTLRVLLTAHLPFVAVLWVMFTVVILIITGVIAMTGGISQSILHHGTTQLPRWLLFGLGIDAVSTYLRMQLAHGRTRREFLGQTLAYMVIVSGFTAVLLTLDYLLETGLYAVFDWPQTLSRVGLFSSADQFPAILGTFWLILLMWTAAGLVIGLGFFRSPGTGILTIPIGLAIVLPSLLAAGNSGLPIFGEDIAELELGAELVLAASAGMLVVAAGLAWGMVRAVPMKSKAP